MHQNTLHARCVARVPVSSRSGKSWDGLDWLNPTERAKHVTLMQREVKALYASIPFQAPEQTAKTAHWLISSATVLGFPLLAATLRALEQRALRDGVGNRDEIPGGGSEVLSIPPTFDLSVSL